MKKILFIYCFLIVSVVFADSPWVVLSETHQYDKASIRKIDGSIMEVYDVKGDQSGYTIRQLRINCKNSQFAIGLSEVYKSRSTEPVTKLDISEKGWLWFDPSAPTDKKLIDIVCKKMS